MFMSMTRFFFVFANICLKKHTIVFNFQEGVFAVWKCDARGRVQHDPLSRHDLGPAVTDCVARPGQRGGGDLDFKLVLFCFCLAVNLSVRIFFELNCLMSLCNYVYIAS